MDDITDRKHEPGVVEWEPEPLELPVGYPPRTPLRRSPGDDGESSPGGRHVIVIDLA